MGNNSKYNTKEYKQQNTIEFFRVCDSRKELKHRAQCGKERKANMTIFNFKEIPITLYVTTEAQILLVKD